MEDEDFDDFDSIKHEDEDDEVKPNFMDPIQMLKVEVDSEKTEKRSKKSSNSIKKREKCELCERYFKNLDRHTCKQQFGDGADGENNDQENDFESFDLPKPLDEYICQPKEQVNYNYLSLRNALVILSRAFIRRK